MPGGDPRHCRGEVGGVRGWLAVVLVVLLAAGTAATYRFDLADRWLPPREAASPAAVAPPPGLDLPPLTRPRPVATAAAAAPLDPAAVRRALAPYLADRDLGPHVLAAVSGLAPDSPLVRIGQGAAIPASTTKVVTALAALATLDPTATFQTRVARSGRWVTLVGGGDPLLAAEPPEAPDRGEQPTWPRRADLTTLAWQTAKRLRQEGVRRVRLAYDDFLFTGPAVTPHWPRDYIPDGVVAPISALWADQGRPEHGDGRVADPPLAAAKVFATALTEAGINVQGPPSRRPVAAAATPVAAVHSATVAEIVEHLLLVSDNEASEVLLRHVGLARYDEGSFAAGLQAVREVLAEHGVPVAGLALHDGSGLSRRNRIAPATLIGVLRIGATVPRFRGLLTGLPVAAFTGSLSLRFAEGPPAGKGRVRAKTGTLTGVTSLAGIATDVSGTPMLFVLMADRVRKPDETDARDAMDSAAAALGACRCRR